MCYKIAHIKIVTSSYARQYIDGHKNHYMLDHICNTAESCIAGFGTLIRELNEEYPIRPALTHPSQRLLVRMIRDEMDFEISPKTFNRLKLINPISNHGDYSGMYRFRNNHGSSSAELIIVGQS